MTDGSGGLLTLQKKGANLDNSDREGREGSVGPEIFLSYTDWDWL